MMTTSTVIANRDAAFLVDPAWRAPELEGLADALDARGWRVVGGFATHAHHDHLLWHPRFGSAPRWASRETAALTERTRASLVAELEADFPRELADLMGRVTGIDALPPLPGGIDAELVVHDGHAPGHTAIWLAGERVLLAGDMLSDIELPLPFDPDDIDAYRTALDLLAPFVAKADVVVPGHGAPGSDAQARLDSDRRYLDAVLSGRQTDDERVRNPGMDAVHARLCALAKSR